jgi:hypothetical protein
MQLNVVEHHGTHKNKPAAAEEAQMPFAGAFRIPTPAEAARCGAGESYQGGGTPLNAVAAACAATSQRGSDACRDVTAGCLTDDATLQRQHLTNGAWHVNDAQAEG